MKRCRTSGTCICPYLLCPSREKDIEKERRKKKRNNISFLCKIQQEGAGYEKDEREKERSRDCEIPVKILHHII